MLETKATNRFKRDAKLCPKRGLDMRKLMRSIFICYELVHILIYLINIELTTHVRKIFLHVF